MDHPTEISTQEVNEGSQSSTIPTIEENLAELNATPHNPKSRYKSKVDIETAQRFSDREEENAEPIEKKSAPSFGLIALAGVIGYLFLKR